MLNVIIPSVIYAECHKYALYTECRYAELSWRQGCSLFCSSSLKKKFFLNFEPEDESEDQFAEEALKAHNMYRARHNVGPLKLDKKVSDGKMALT